MEQEETRVTGHFPATWAAIVLDVIIKTLVGKT